MDAATSQNDTCRGSNAEAGDVCSTSSIRDGRCWKTSCPTGTKVYMPHSMTWVEAEGECLECIPASTAKMRGFGNDAALVILLALVVGAAVVYVRAARAL